MVNRIRQSQYRTIGLMSGSSLDALDIVCCDFALQKTGNGSFKVLYWNLVAGEEVPIPDEIKQKIQRWQELNQREIHLLDKDFAFWMGDSVIQFLNNNNLKASLIGSHGHTLWHSPTDQISFQLGHGAYLAAQTGMPVVFDFRKLDMAHGGQGAPMVPVAEKYLWPEYAYFVNLGGIANISCHKTGRESAWDCIACNQILNSLAAELNLPYDPNGNFARLGKINPKLQEIFKSIEFLYRPSPKSLDNTYVQETFIAPIQAFEANIFDKLHTATDWIASQISIDLLNCNIQKNEKVLVTGGGSFNTFLIELIREKLSLHGENAIVPGDEIIKFKEAIMIAFAAFLRYLGLPNFLSAYSGAKKNVSGGLISLP